MKIFKKNDIVKDKKKVFTPTKKKLEKRHYKVLQKSKTENTKVKYLFGKKLKHANILVEWVDNDGKQKESYINPKIKKDVVYKNNQLIEKKGKIKKGTK